MVNRSNRGLETPRLTLGRNVSDNLLDMNTGTGAVSGSLGALSAAADAFSRGMTDMANKAASRDGEAAAAADLKAGVGGPLDPGKAFNDSYNAAMKAARGAAGKAAISEGIDQALINHSDDPDAFTSAATAVVEGYGSTGFADLDLDLRNYATLQVANGRTSARKGQYLKGVEAARGAFLTTLQSEEALISQAVQTASFDPAGSALVGEALNRTMGNLAKYGPKGAFTVGNIEFAADETRLGVIGADDLARTYVDVQAKARTVWAVNAAEALPDATSKAKFVEDARAKRAAGDPLFEGLDIAQFEGLVTQLESVANKAERQQEADQADAGQDARDMIEALRWGGDVDEDLMLKQAAASGDVGLMAQARVMASIGPQVPAILRRVRGGTGGGGDDDGVVGLSSGVWDTPDGLAPGSPEFVAWENTRDGFASDPIKYAHGTKKRAALADVPALDPDGALDDGERGQAWSQSIRRRAGLGGALSKTYAVPDRMLTNAEKSYYASQIEADPSYAVRLSQSALRAIGPQGARRLMAEIGKDSSVGGAIHMGDLDVIGSGNIVRKALEGQALKAQGAKDVPYEGRNFDDVQAEYAPALKHVPALLIGARAVAEDARRADALKGINNPPEFYLNSALGATQKDGKVYGGIDRVNGRETILPHWLARGSGQDAMRVMAKSWVQTGRGPVYSNGQPMREADIRKLQWVLLPSGNYGFVNPSTNAVVRAKAGYPFEIDMEKARAFLGAQIPKQVRGR